MMNDEKIEQWFYRLSSFSAETHLGNLTDRLEVMKNVKVGGKT